MTPLGALEASALGQAMRQWLWLYPAVETAHIVGIALLFGSIAVLDLRLLGVWKRVPVKPLAAQVLPSLNPVGLLLRVLYAMGVPFEAVDRRQLIDFYTAESSYGDATDIVTTFVGAFRSLRLGSPTPLACSHSPAGSSAYHSFGP